MKIIGLHILDIAVVLLYLIVILWIGKRVSKRSTTTDEYFIAGRKLGKVYQFFLNFGNSTNADQAVAVSREIYRQGIAGMWIQYIVLFLTPFYWFTTFLFRRSRLVTIGDFFAERFQSQFLAGAYAAFTILMAFIGGGVGYTIAAKTFMALTPKHASEYSLAEKEMVANYQEFKRLQSYPSDSLTVEQQDRLEVLSEKNKRSELKSFVSYTDSLTFIIIYALIVGVYTLWGGFLAAAITDAIQGVLLIVFSIILIPMALNAIGGFSGLHASVPDYMFELFGSSAFGDYEWYTIAAMAFANLVSIVAAATMMATAGSAQDETTARVGMIGGMFFKRLIMLFWALAGLLALGLYGDQLHDPDLIWGFMSYNLLAPGAIGLMLAGVLAANMSTLDAGAVTNSALFIKNLYQPFRPDKTDAHYLLIGRFVVAAILIGGIFAALFADGLLELFKYFISLPAIFGASIWLGFVWRRVTTNAVIAQVIICFTIFAIIPNLFQQFDAFRLHAPFLIETLEHRETVIAKADQEDVLQQKAEAVGEQISSVLVSPPVGVFFDKVARRNPENRESEKIGIGRFHAEIWVLSWFGIDFTRWTKAQLVAIRFAFDGMFPFLLLFVFSVFTKRQSKKHLDHFFAKIHTSVRQDITEDRRAIEQTLENIESIESRKLFANSQWEIMKPGWIDIVGFGGSWVLVILILISLWIMVNIGS